MKRLACMLVCVVGVALMLALPASAQQGYLVQPPRSNAANITLVANIQESFSIKYAVVPAAQPFTGDAKPMAQTLQVWLNWNFRQARDFQIEYKLERSAEADSTISGSGLMSLRQLRLMSYVFSFRPIETNGPAVLSVSGNSETEPVGQAALLMALPQPNEDAPATVRISVVIL